MDNACKELRGIIQNTIDRFAEKEAVIESDSSYSYGQLDHKANTIAYSILSYTQTTGVPVRRIGIHMSKGFNALSSIWSICKIGRCYVPLVKQMPEDRLKFMIDDCKVDVILTDGSSDYYFDNVFTIDVTSLPDTYPVEIDKMIANNLIDNDYAYIIYTSGSTGKPKGTPIRFSSLLNFVGYISKPEYFDMTSDSRVLQYTSFSFDISIFEIFTPFTVGAAIIVPTEKERLDINKLYNLINDRKVTIVMLTPSVANLFRNFNFPSMRKFSTGGEKIMLPIIQKAMGKNFDLINIYGPTENTVLCTVKNVKSEADLLSIGSPTPGTVGYVLDLDGNPLKEGEIGELCVGGKQLTTGYINRPELNKACFIDNPFQNTDGYPVLYRTGDKVRQIKDGSFEYIGRFNDCVKYNGYRIELLEIERVIEKCDDIEQACVCLNNTGDSSVLAAYVKLKNKEQKDCSKVKNEIKKFLPIYMVPSLWVIVDEFPYNFSGKVDKKALVAKYSDSIVHQKEYANSKEEIVANVVANVLGVSSVDVNADLFDQYGMTSMQCMKIPLSLEVSGLHFTIEDIYQNRSIRNIVNNHKSRISYWFNEPSEEKPVLILVSGYTSFSLIFQNMAKALQDAYSIYVLESYHEYPMDYLSSCDSLTDVYVDLLRPIASKYQIKAISGFCLGGEIGLALAKKMSETLSIFPHVVVLDGEVARSNKAEENIPVYFDMFPHELNVKRNTIDWKLMTTLDNLDYKGQITSILCSRFFTNLSPFSMRLKVTELQAKCAKEFFDRAPRYWEKYYPECTILYVDADHSTLIPRPESKYPIYNYFLSLVNKASAEYSKFHFVEGREQQ